MNKLIFKRTKACVLIIVFLLATSSLCLSQEIDVDAETIIKKAIDKIGSEAKLQRVSGCYLSAFMYNAEGVLYCFYSATLKKPDYLEERFLYGTDKNFTQTYENGMIKFIKDYKEIKDEGLLDAQKQKLEWAVQYSPFAFFYLFNRGNKYNYLGNGKVNVSDCFIIEFVDGFGSRIKFFIDQQTYLILKRESETSEHFFFDYKEIDDIYFPCLIRTYSSGTLKTTVEIDSSSVEFLY